MTINKLLNYLIAAVWIANGLFCKVLNLVPRHQEIVARIIGNAHAGILTRLIGVAEIAMAVWILSGFRTKLNAITQAVIIATMNSLEFMLAPDLLLWGRFNALYAFLFILVILVNEFCLRNRQTQLT
jgi:DoxX-like family